MEAAVESMKVYILDSVVLETKNGKGVIFQVREEGVAHLLTVAPQNTHLTQHVIFELINICFVDR